MNESTSTAAATFLREKRVLHWSLYVMEGGLLALFMISACVFTVLFEHPASPAYRGVPSPLIRRCMIGIAMGLTAVLLIYSKWGRKSGAHMNPAFTLSFLWLGKINPWDALFYIVGQFVGGAMGVGLCKALAGAWMGHPAVNYAVTLPGHGGELVAWIGEFLIALILMCTVLMVNRVPRLGPYTGYFAAALVALYIAVEAPLSGMSLNPARTVASAVWANVWSGLWIYFTAPLAGMLTAVEIQRVLGHHPHLLCAKLNRCPKARSIFHCNCAACAGIHPELPAPRGQEQDAGEGKPELDSFV